MRAHRCPDLQVSRVILLHDPHAADHVVGMQRPGVLADVADHALLRHANHEVAKTQTADGAKAALLGGPVACIDEIGEGRGTEDDGEQGTHAVNGPAEKGTPVFGGHKNSGVAQGWGGVGGNPEDILTDGVAMSIPAKPFPRVAARGLRT